MNLSSVYPNSLCGHWQKSYRSDDRRFIRECERTRDSRPPPLLPKKRELQEETTLNADIASLDSNIYSQEVEYSDKIGFIISVASKDAARLRLLRTTSSVTKPLILLLRTLPSETELSMKRHI